MPNPVTPSSFASLAVRLRLLLAALLLVPAVLLAAVPAAQADEESELSAAAVSAPPARIGLQVGHWRANELPAELSRLRTATGGSGGGVREVDVNLQVTRKVAERLRELGHTVDVLPATVPPKYQADLFVAVHADATSSSSARGFKLARGRNSRLGAIEDRVIALVRAEYARATGMPWSRSITLNMTGYYAFASGRFSYTIAPTTPGVILEMGYLTNATDRAILTGGQDRIVEGVVDGLQRYLAERQPIPGGTAITAPVGDCRYFPETGEEICGPFKQAWEQQGGLTRFGYPLSGLIDEHNPETGKEHSVQYFERARFEHFPNQAGTPGEVQFSLLGRMLTADRQMEKPFLAIDAFADYEERRFFPETGHSLAGGFKHYWTANGGVEVFGFPISEEFEELNVTDGKVYTVQYFERARFEYHPEHKGTPYETELGHLGRLLFAGG